MTYTARRVAKAAERWPLTIGATTYWARPISAALALRVLPHLSRPETAPAMLALVLDAAFERPRGWRRWAWWRDPLRLIAKLEPAIQGRIVAQLFALPADPAEEVDPMAALIAAHKKAATGGTAADSAPTLALAALTCQARLGAGWWYAPHLWPTADGCAPLAAVWVAYAGLQALDAQTLMTQAQAAQFGAATGPQVAREWVKLKRAAYPQDPSVRGGH